MGHGWNRIKKCCVTLSQFCMTLVLKLMEVYRDIFFVDDQLIVCSFLCFPVKPTAISISLSVFQVQICSSFFPLSSVVCFLLQNFTLLYGFYAR